MQSLPCFHWGSADSSIFLTYRNELTLKTDELIAKYLCRYGDLFYGQSPEEESLVCKRSVVLIP